MGDSAREIMTGGAERIGGNESIRAARGNGQVGELAAAISA